MSHAHRHTNYAQMSGAGDVWGPPASVYDDLTECPLCDGAGHIVTDCDDHGKAYVEECEACKGSGWLDSDGNPYKEMEQEE